MRTLLLGLLLLTLAACGATPSGTDTTGTASSAPSTPAAPSAAPSPASSADASTGGSLELPTGSSAAIGSGDALDRQATALLAQQINAPAETLTLQSREEMQWSDSSLGCPDPATSYMQVITPGFRLTYSDGTKTYNLHTDSTGKRVVWCDNGQPKEIGQP